LAVLGSHKAGTLHFGTRVGLSQSFGFIKAPESADVIGAR
jgi:hypothetical protein